MPFMFNPFSGLFDYYVVSTGVVPVTPDGVYLSEASEYLITEAGDNLATEG